MARFVLACVLAAVLTDLFLGTKITLVALPLVVVHGFITRKSLEDFEQLTAELEAERLQNAPDTAGAADGG